MKKKGGRRWKRKSERPRANHGNIMPQRPRAQYLSGVAAENDHWLRHWRLTLPILSPSRSRQHLFASGIYLERGS